MRTFSIIPMPRPLKCTIESVTSFPEEKEDPLEQYYQNAIDQLRLKAKEFEKDSVNSEVGPDVQLIIPSRLSELFFFIFERHGLYSILNFQE